MINYSNVNKLIGGGSPKAYGFFASEKKGHGGLSSEEHDRRLKLREEAYEMRRQRGQARKAEDRRFASDQAFSDRRREASTQISEDIARMRALHPVKLELERDSHAQDLVHRNDVHKQSLVHDVARSAVKLDATKAVDAHKLTHEVTRVQTMQAATAPITAAKNTQALGHRAAIQAQDLGFRDAEHAQRLTHFEDQVRVGMRRRAPAGVGASSTPAAPSLQAPAAQVVMPHPSVQVVPRGQSTTPKRTRSAAPAPAPRSTTPSSTTPKSAAPKPGPVTSTPAQSGRLDSAVNDIQSAMGGHLRQRSDHDARPDTTPAAASVRPKRSKPAAPVASVPSTSAPLLRPKANTSVKLAGSESFEHVSGKFSWDKRPLAQRMKTQLPGERVESREESTARIKTRRRNIGA